MTLFAARKTLVTPTEMLASLQAAWPEANRASLCVLLAQWALETGRGKSMICYNCAGIKQGSYPDYTEYDTFEIIGGKRVNMRDKFRAYATLDEGVADYLMFLRARFASAWPAVVAGSPEQFVQALKIHGYFTADVGEYTRAVRGLFNEFFGLVPALVVPSSVEDTQPVSVAPLLDGGAVTSNDIASDAVADYQAKKES